MEKYLKVGTLLKASGLKGELRIYITTSLFEKRFRKNSAFFIENETGKKDLTLKSIRRIKGNIYTIAFNEITSIEETEVLENKDLLVVKNQKDLPKGEFFYDDLVDLEVYDKDLNLLGKVAKVEEFPAQITLKILKKDSEEFFYLPFVDIFIDSISLEDERIVINLIEGLLWDLLS